MSCVTKKCKISTCPLWQLLHVQDLPGFDGCRISLREKISDVLREFCVCLQHFFNVVSFAPIYDYVLETFNRYGEVPQTFASYFLVFVGMNAHKIE